MNIKNYFLDTSVMNEEVKVWCQMFFDDGSVTQGKYLPRYLFDDEAEILRVAREFLDDTHRNEGVIFIWGAGRVYGKRCELTLLTRGTLKGSKTLRLRNL